MTRNTVFLYYKFTDGDASRASARELSLALDAFWQKTGLESEKILRTPKGKPYFSSGSFHLSVTHTGNFFAAAFSPRPIGIDAERSKESRPRIAEKKFTPEERALPFSAVWCGKEAVAKLVGEGLGGMNRVLVGEGLARFDGKRYLLREKIIGEYRLTVATEEGWDYGTETLSEK